MLHSRILALVLLTFTLTSGHDCKANECREASNVIIKQTNTFRSKHNLQELKIDKTLTKAAQAFADFMAKTQKYGHHADDRRPAQRVLAAGYKYCLVRENIAYRTDPNGMKAAELSKHFTSAWINSPGHRANMLSANVTDTAVAVASSDGKTFYAVQLFARPESLTYRVVLTNSTETDWTIRIDTEGESKDVQVPSRGVLKFQRCFATVLSIVGKNARKRVDKMAELEIEIGDDGPLIK